jgi:MoaA/NifB/PqqE/SkfB family radical SAM enzyme
MRLNNMEVFEVEDLIESMSNGIIPDMIHICSGLNDYMNLPNVVEKISKKDKDNITICVMILPDNIDFIDEIFDAMFDRGVRKFKFYIPMSAGSVYTLPISDIRSKLKAVMDFGIDSGCEMRIEGPICVCHWFKDKFLKTGRKYVFGNACAKCQFNKDCEGIGETHYAKFGEQELDLFLEILAAPKINSRS